MKIKIFLTILSFAFAMPSMGNCLPWLQTKGTNIIDEEGNIVILRGINLGGWLVEEMWMLPFVDKSADGKASVVDHVTLWYTIEKRFGTKKMLQMRSAYRKAWIKDSDFVRIQQAGLNCVRLPFLASLTEEEKGLEIIDYAIEQCRKQGLYVILDMHGTFGCQSKEDHTGEAGQNKLFQDPEMVKKTATAWTMLANRYKDCSTVAAYDLMNEPMGAPSNKVLYEVYNTFYQAVRKVDSRHLIFIEDGYKGIQYAPKPDKMDWRKVVLSTHTYFGGEETKDECLKKFEEHIEKVSKAQQKCNIPHYLGEFNVKPSSNAGAIMAQVIALLQEKNRSWSVWTYKVGGRNLPGKGWGLYGTSKQIKRIDPFLDSEQEIFKKIEMLSTENFTRNEGLFDAFQKTLRVQVGRNKPEVVKESKNHSKK